MRVVVLLACLVAFSLSTDQHATASVRLNKSLFHLASNKIKAIIDSVIPGLPIPPIDIRTEGGVHFYTRWINLTQFDFPRTSFDISPKGLNWKTVGGKIQLKMHFVARYTLPPTHISITQTGYATVTVEELKTNINALIKTTNSRPRLITNNCAIDVEKIDAEIQAGMPGWIISLFKGIIIDYAQDNIKKNGCDLVNSLVTKANDFVKKQPEEIRVWRNIYLNYTAQKDPVFHIDYIEAECSFRVAVHDNSSVPGLLEMDYFDNYFSAEVLKSIWREEATVSSPSESTLSVLSILKDIAFYLLVLYCLASMIASLVGICRKRVLKIGNDRILIAFENEALNDK